MPRRSQFVSLLLVCSFTYACGEDEHKLASKSCRPNVSSCDIEQTSCVESLLELTACVRGDDPPPLPEVEHLHASEVADRLVEMLEAQGEMDPSPWDSALRALELLPAGTSSTEVAIAQFVESVAAYYDPATNGITIITDSSAGTDALSRMYVLSHELTHYLQDREHDLEEMREQSGKSTDRVVALSALVEGDAVVTSTRVLIQLMGRSSNNFAWKRYFGALQDDMTRQIEASPAPLAEAVQDLPYTVGGLAVANRWNVAGRDGVDALFEERPGALCDWLEEELDPEESLIEALECAPPRAPNGFSLYELDSFGAAGAYALLVAAGAGDLELASALRNDAIALYVPEDAEDLASAAVIAVWRLRFDDARSAQTFETLIAGTNAAMDVQRTGAELSIRVSSDPQRTELRGAALEACPKLDDLEPAHEVPVMPRAWLRRGFGAL